MRWDWRTKRFSLQRYGIQYFCNVETLFDFLRKKSCWFFFIWIQSLWWKDMNRMTFESPSLYNMLGIFSAFLTIIIQLINFPVIELNDKDVWIEKFSLLLSLYNDILVNFPSGTLRTLNTIHQLSVRRVSQQRVYVCFFFLFVSLF